MDNPVYHAFTFKYSAHVQQLKTPVDIMCGAKSFSGEAIWDTGASGTCISGRVVDELKLIPTGKRTMLTPQGSMTVNTYLVNVVLPNKVTVEDVEVCGSSIENQGLAMLIGMDIISFGDFTVSQPSSGTVFTFRLPSKAKTDYVQEINIENLVGTHGPGKRKKKKKK